MAAPTPLWHAYVDECGDRGWKLRPLQPTPSNNKGSSGLFAATAVLVPDGAQTSILTAWDQAAQDIGRPSGTPLHWVNVRSHGQRRHLIRTIADQTDIHTISVILCKHHLPPASGLRSAEYLYNWTLRLLLERVSWFAKDRGASTTLTFAQIKGVTPIVINTYLTRLQAMPTNIEWSHLRTPPRIDTPANRRMLQVADAASGAVYAAFEPDEYGQTEQGYLVAMKPRIWHRYSSHPLSKSGIKLGPWPNAAEALHVPWFADFCAP